MTNPLVAVTLAYSLGIVIGQYIIIPPWVSLLTMLLLLSVGLYLLRQQINILPIILALFCLLGLFIFQFNEILNKDEISKYADKGYCAVIGTISDMPRGRERALTFPLDVEAIIDEQKKFYLSGLITIVIPDLKAPLSYGEKIEVRGRIKRQQSFNNPLMAQAESKYGLFATSYSVLPERNAFCLKQWAIFFSQRLNYVLTNILPPKEGALLGSFLLGSTVSPLPEEQKDTYRRAGLIHLLVVSGTQVSILIGLSLNLTRSLSLPLWLSIGITSFFNLMLVIVTGAGASILRAAIMGEIALIGTIFDRQKDFYTTLALSALIILLFEPRVLFDLGFQLSFAATWSLVYIAPILKEWLKKRNGKLLSITTFLAMTLAPLLATSPILAYNFSQISWGGLISNLLVLPWVEFLVILGLVSTLLGFICLPLAQIMGQTIWLLLVLLENIANCVAALPGACFYITPPTLPIIIGYYILLLGFLEAIKRDMAINITRKKIIFVFCLFTTIWFWHEIFLPAGFGQNELKVTFLDVGQGDCALVEMPNGKKVLIDGGGTDKQNNQSDKDAIGERVVVPWLRRRGINKLDLVILTHPHNDHLGGLNSVLAKIKIDRIVDNGTVYSSAAYQRFKELIAVNKIKHFIAHQGQVINFDRNIHGEILNPARCLLGETNSDSVVMRLVYNKVSFLFTGDLGEMGEERLLGSLSRSIRSTILKVGHHGSATSTSDEFLKRVLPKYSVISVGAHNRYRHPAYKIIEKLNKNRSEVYRTDKAGAITIRTDGQRVTIDCQGGPRSPKRVQPSS